MKLFVFTQVVENYGSATCPRWKFKGGSEYCVARLSYSDAAQAGHEGLWALVQAALERHNISCSNDIYQEHLLDWSLEEDDYHTPDERCQLEFEGKIVYPHRDLTVVNG